MADTRNTLSPDLASTSQSTPDSRLIKRQARRTSSSRRAYADFSVRTSKLAPGLSARALLVRDHPGIELYASIAMAYFPEPLSGYCGLFRSGTHAAQLNDPCCLLQHTDN